MVYNMTDLFYNYSINLHLQENIQSDFKASMKKWMATYNSLLYNANYKKNNIDNIFINDLPVLQCHIFSYDSLPHESDNFFDDNMLFCYIHDENMLDELLPDIAFKYTILAGPSSISYFNICPDICHYYNVPFVIDKTDNLLFREATINDFNKVYNIMKNEAVHNIFSMKPENAIDEYINLISQFKLLNCGLYCIYNNEILIGFICINYRIKENAYETSYYITEKFRKKTFAKTYLNKASKYFYSTHSCDDILYCKINSDNLASIQTAITSGFKKKNVLNDINYFYYEL